LAYNRLVTKLTKENLWLYILRMLSERPMYAYEIGKSLKKRFDFSVATVTVYVVLYKMQIEGLITVTKVAPSKERSDRKYYKITDKGKEIFQKGQFFIQETIKKLK
jgi:PadR family transcriptional regulator PadR